MKVEDAVEILEGCHRNPSDRATEAFGVLRAHVAELENLVEHQATMVESLRAQLAAEKARPSADRDKLAALSDALRTILRY